MSENAWSRRRYAVERGGRPSERPHAPWGVVLAAVVAVAASAGLAWRFAVPDRPADLQAAPRPAGTRSGPGSLRYAAAKPDADQVRHAWRDVQAAYGKGGAGALGRASTSCASRLPADPGLLDYCLAYDMYAAEIVPALQEAWFGDPHERELALARAVLPEGVDPAGRVAEVDALTRAVSAEPPPPAAAKPQHVRTLQPPPRGAVQPVRAADRHAERPRGLKASVRSKVRPAQQADATWCALERTEADWLVCANSELAAADQRMKRAYDAAIAGGVDPEILGRQQEAWREVRDRAPDGRALRELYSRRIEDLESLTPPY
jgi:hypothetical protein